MKITGIIAEYNPFHNGHAYHMQKSLELSGADHVIIVMSGDYVQRGAPAIVSKHIRAKAALLSGASVVLQLPVRYSVGSAERFAMGAVSLLNSLGCVDSICFGSESGNLHVLSEKAELLLNEPETYQAELRRHLRAGHSFPLASEKAALSVLGDSSFSNTCAGPNDILGTLYLKALKKLKSPLKPISILRKHSDHHDPVMNAGISSATSIRHALESAAYDVCAGQMPPSAAALIKDSLNTQCPVTSDDFSLLLRYRLLTESAYSLTDYMDIDDDLANRIMNNMEHFSTLTQFTDLIKTKNNTYTRISRALFHILLNIRKSDEEGSDICSYTQILGFRKDNDHVLRTIKQHTNIPLVTKLSTPLPGMAGRIQEQDILASEIFESVAAHKFARPYQNPYRHPVERV